MARGLTQERLAEGAGLHTTYLSDVERGLRNIGVINLDRLASALSVDLATLMREVERQRRGEPGSESQRVVRAQVRGPWASSSFSPEPTAHDQSMVLHSRPT